MQDILIKNHFDVSTQLYASQRVIFNDFVLMLSDEIEDNYWNIAIKVDGETIDDIKSIWPKIKTEMLKKNREPAILIPNTSLLNPSTLKPLNFEPIYQDCWMVLEEFKEYPTYKSELDINILKVDNNLKEEFISAVMTGFSGDDPNDPYNALPECYATSLRKSFDKKIEDYKLVQYLVKYNNISVGTASVISGKEIALIYNITTNKEYKRKGICKELMSNIIYSLADDIEIVCLQTEKGFYTEFVYKNLGFKEVFTSYAYKEIDNIE